VTVHHGAAHAGALNTLTQTDDESELEEVDDYGKLRKLLSTSLTNDTYCRSALYFALTGRRKVWIVSYKDKYLVLLFHPNVPKTLLVFCPFVSSASELAEQLAVLTKCQKFLTQFEDHEVFLARIPELIAEDFLSRHAMGLLNCKPERVPEKILDWVYPSYDIELQNLLNLQGRKLKIYRKKLRKFCDQDIEVRRPADFSPQELIKAVREVNKGWVRTKLTSDQTLGISPRKLMSCYRTMVRLNGNASLAMDGLILKRKEAYIAFSFWERPAKGNAVACLAALPVSHEKGLSEYLYYAIAKCLKGEKEEYREMCIGGSETASLDQFKKKLAPSRAHELRTIRISLKASKPASTPEDWLVFVKGEGIQPPVRQGSRRA
jgi:hypothetical protein